MSNGAQQKYRVGNKAGVDDGAQLKREEQDGNQDSHVSPESDPSNQT